ncbi:MAG: hypothetical protein ACO1SV_25385 [Fimbriimonas sp.]
MKNQNDLIFSIVAAVIGIGFAAGFYFTKREPIAPPAPQTVPTAAVALPAPEPARSNGLSGGGNAAGGFPGGGRGPGGGGMMPGGPSGPSGMPGMPGRPGGGGGMRPGGAMASS